MKSGGGDLNEGQEGAAREALASMTVAVDEVGKGRKGRDGVAAKAAVAAAGDVKRNGCHCCRKQYV